MAILVVALLTSAGGTRATDGVYETTRHGDGQTGVQRLAEEPVGDCAHCHDMHASRDGVPTGGPHPYVLFAPNDNALCSAAGCHVGSGALGIYSGPVPYAASSHGTSPQVVWPGPDPRARPAGGAGDCLNCHTPHGRADALGLVPSLLALREEDGCLGCHDISGPASTDVAGDLNKSHVHPVTNHAGRHVPGESDSAAFSTSRRHAECSDCHNPHDARSTGPAPPAPAASPRLGRVSRVAVSNGAAGSQPAYTFRPADDPAPVLEYEVCFKCHSSWATLPPGRSDLATLLNPANASYHPVEAAGRDSAIDPASFASGWGPFDLMRCGDCHGSDDGGPAGPHGSVHAGLLVAPLPASPGLRPMDPGELCFRCHAHATYANPSSPAAVQAASRWNGPLTEGHAKHAEKNVTCYSCHAVHGVTDQPHLLQFGRNPGIISWVNLGNKRTCASTCHGLESYDANY